LQVFRPLIVLFFSFALILGLSQPFTQVQNPQTLLAKYKIADRLYREGEAIINRKDYSEEKEKQLNQAALISFKNLRTELEKTEPSYDSLGFFTNFKIGVLEHYFDNYSAAKKGYANAISLKDKLPLLGDSFLFKPYLYLGIILYNENLFDSSLVIYKKAEGIARSYSSTLQETERLYNTLGVLYYETGNYKQAKNYTEKSLAVIPRSNPYYKELVVNYKINLASILTKLEEFDDANRIYQEILPLNINRDIILHNLGVINLNLGATQKALEFFRKVNYTDNRISRLYNDMAIAFMNNNKKDSAVLYLRKAEARDTNTERRTVVKGQTNQTWGDWFVSENKFDEALHKYQAAITNYYPAYNGTNAYENPGEFSGVFSYINLFSTLTSKAEAFEKLYQQEKSISFLKASLDAYTSAFKLAEYVERSYDSDEARLFLNKIKYGVHSKPIDISLLLYEQTKEENYFEQAWQFDQMNKASILSYNISENERRNADSLTGRTKHERNTRSIITRLSLKAAKENDPGKLKEISNSIRDYEIELGKIQDSIAATTKSKNIKPPIPSVKWLQRNLLDDNTALLSYHLSEKDLLILCFNKNEFTYKKIPAEATFYSTIDSFVQVLHTITGEIKFEGTNIAQRLYSWLIDPVLPAISHMKRIIIIPDDELTYIPFEALQDSTGHYLMQQFSVQYQYSASLLEKHKRKIASAGILSFAPFANATTNRLTYSADEIKDLKGKTYIDQEGTKENFLLQANRFPVIHFATHAQVNDTKPLQSFISFANNANDSTEGKLYAQEIYDLSLDSTQLVILSACETGTGQLVHGEGMMSLSRAFAYAGCPDIVTSLWKAEDKTTAFLARRFHYYLAKNKTTDMALHLAKLDLLGSNEIDERLKTPNYWAHMIFIGEYEPAPSASIKWWLGIPILFYVIGWYIYKRRNKVTSSF
jgi:CHAT domain-containing protein